MSKVYETTLKKLLDSCAEDGDCMVWRGLASKSGVPKVNIKVDGGRTVLSTRRIVWGLVKGDIKPGRLITTSCGNARCLNPDHLKTTNHAEVSKKNGSRLLVKIKKVAGQDFKNSKLTREQAQQIRASELEPKELAAMYPVTAGHIKRIKSGMAWKDYTNPFAGLGA